MKRLLSSTIIVSVAFLPVAPMPAMAQSFDEYGRIVAADGTVLCEPTADFACDINDPAIAQAAADIQAQLDANAQAEAEAAAQAEAEAAAQAEAEAAAQAEAEAAAQAEAEAAAQAEAEAAAQAEAEAAAQAEAEAAAQAEAEAAAQAEAEAAAQAEAEAAAQAEAEAAAQAEAEAAAQAEAEAAAQAEAEAAAQAEAEAAAQAEAEAEAEAAAQAEAEAAAQEEAVDPAAEEETDTSTEEAVDPAQQEAIDAANAALADAQANVDGEGRITAIDGTVLCEPTADAACDITDPEILQSAQEIQAGFDPEVAPEEETDTAAEEAVDPAQQEAIDAANAALADAQANVDGEGRITAIDGTVLCEPTADAACDITDPAILQSAQEIQAGFDPEVAPEEETADNAADETVDPAQQEAIDAANAALADAQANVDGEGRITAIDGTVLCEPTDDAACDITDPAILQSAQEIQAGFDPEVAPEEETADTAAQEEIDQANIEQAEVENFDAEGNPIDPAAELAVEETPIDPDAPLIDAPEISDTESEALTTLLDAPIAGEGEPAAPEVAAASDEVPVVIADPDTDEPVDPALAEETLAALPESENTLATTVETIAPEAARTSAQEFKAAPQVAEDGRKTGLSDLERVGLFVLGAVVVGQVLDGITGRTKVVSNTGDRVVVQRPDGRYALLKDDDAILRQPGSTVRTETFNDGSSRTIVQRADGTQVVTVRDATGRVLRRAQYDRLGRELVLVDDFAAEVPVNPRSLPRPRITQSTSNAADAAIRAEVARREIARLNRGFSLRQIRDIPEIRALAAEVDVDRVTFKSGSAAITPQQANSLADLGEVMTDMLYENPAEMFLIEGHTDAVGSAASNLALSDRRAESVALALTEYFGIPPENMIVQGYGESELRIKTQRDEPRNRRVVVRIITPLLKAGG